MNDEQTLVALRTWHQFCATEGDELCETALQIRQLDALRAVNAALRLLLGRPLLRAAATREGHPQRTGLATGALEVK